jgi:hypothetical protein
MDNMISAFTANNYKDIGPFNPPPQLTDGQQNNRLTHAELYMRHNAEFIKQRQK